MNTLSCDSNKKPTEEKFMPRPSEFHSSNDDAFARGVCSREPGLSFFPSMKHGFDSRIPLFPSDNSPLNFTGLLSESEPRQACEAESWFFSVSRGVPCGHFQPKEESRSEKSTVSWSGQRSLSFWLSLRKEGISLFSNKQKESRSGITVIGKSLVLVLAILTICSTGNAKSVSSSHYFNGNASWYSTECCRFNPTKACPTASGESLFLLEKNDVDFAAMWDVPLQSRVKVTCVTSGKSVIVTIKDRGPAKRLHRVIDLSKSAFQKISDTKLGIIKVKVEVLP